jgi:phage-related tail fiber protein
MNTGKIMIGFSLVLLSVAMMVSPSGATGSGDPCDVGCGIVVCVGESGCPAGMHPGSGAQFWYANEPCTDATYPYER